MVGIVQAQGQPQKQNALENSGTWNARSSNGGNNYSRSSRSMTSAAASQQTSSNAQNVPSSSSSSKAAQQTGKTSSATSTSSTSTGSTSSSSSSSSGTYTGEATFYYQGGVAGACGSVSSDSSKVVALQTSMYGSGEYCGKTITITNTGKSSVAPVHLLAVHTADSFISSRRKDTGASTTATVADECPSCSGSSSIDLSTGAFDAIGSEDTGVLNVSWSFN